MNAIRVALSLGFALTPLAGCGGSQPPIGAPVALPQSRAIVRRNVHGTTMSRTTSNDLLYITGGGTNQVYVFTYPEGKLVQTLTGFQNPNGECVDASGNVYITQSTGYIFEYAHGGSSPINSFYAAYANYGCAIDLTTGNLAAATAHAVTVWPHGQWSPITYTNPNKYVLERYLTYDISSNLFIGGDNVCSGRPRSFRTSEWRLVDHKLVPQRPLRWTLQRWRPSPMGWHGCRRWLCGMQAVDRSVSDFRVVSLVCRIHETEAPPKGVRDVLA